MKLATTLAQSMTVIPVSVECVRERIVIVVRVERVIVGDNL